MSKIKSILEGLHSSRLNEAKDYYVIKKDVKSGKEELLDVVKASNEKEARSSVTQKYMDIVLSGTHNLIVVGKAGYEKYHTDIIKN